MRRKLSSVRLPLFSPFAATIRALGNALRPAATVFLLGLCVDAAAQTSLGAFNIGAGGTATVTVSIPGGGTAASISVVTQGAPNLDFTNAGGGSCATGVAYAANAACTVIVAFAPRFPGTRYGAVVLTDSGNNVIATSYLVGTGQGPQTVFSSLIAAWENIPVLPGTYTAIAVDASGSAFLVDPTGFSVIKATPAAGGVYTTSAVFGGSGKPTALAVDGSGAVYVMTVENGNFIFKMTPSGAGYKQTTVDACLAGACTGIAVDAGGNVYFGDGSFGRVWKDTVSSGGYSSSVIATFAGVTDVKTDGGNVYVLGSLLASPLTQGVYKLTPSSNGYTQTTVVSGGVDNAIALAVDGDGSVYLNLDFAGGIVEEALSNGAYTQTVLLPGDLAYCCGLGYGAIAVDQAGNVYWGNAEFILAVPPSFLFDQTAQGQLYPYTSFVSVGNAGNQPLKFSEVGYPPDFPEANNAGNCASSTTLAVGQTCSMAIDFLPVAPLNGQSSLTLNEAVTIATNTLGSAGTQQSIAVTGTETQPSSNPIVPPGFTVSGPNVTVAPGATTGNTSTIIVTPSGGFTGSVTLTAAITFPPNPANPPTFSFGSTSPVNITGAVATTATLTISTTAPSTSGCTSLNLKPRGVPWYAGGSAVLACVLLFGIPARRRRWLTFLGMMALLVALTGGLLACGGGGGSGCTPVFNPGTTAGPYIVTVTGTSGATTATNTFGLTVQ